MDRAQPGAIDSIVRNYELGDALGQFSGGWVVPASEPTASAQRSDLDETAFTAFDQTSSSSSLTVTIGPGEAFVNGWLGIDTATDVALSASTTGQTVGVSWDPDAAFDPQTDADRDAADRVVVALESDVSELDPFLPLWTFDTDGSGVTSVVDERDVGPSIEPEYLAGAEISAAPSGEFLRKATDGLEFAEIVAGATVQETEPSSPGSGELWYDPGSALLKVYADNGSGADWQPVPPVQVLEEASTFTEDDISISHTQTKVSDNSISLSSVTSPTRSRTDDGDQNNGNSGKYGLKINPNQTLGGLIPTVSTNTQTSDTSDGSTYAQILDSNYNVLEQVDITGLAAGDTFEIRHTLQQGVDYYIAHAFGSDVGQFYDRGFAEFPGFPFQFSEFDIPAGLYATSVSDRFACAFNDIKALTPASSGEAVVAFDTGSIDSGNSYDLATYDVTKDNATATVDVVDGQGNVLYSDIRQNFDISTVDPSKNVKLRVNLSRNDTSNNPTLNYAARRYTL